MRRTTVPHSAAECVTFLPEPVTIRPPHTSGRCGPGRTLVRTASHWKRTAASTASTRTAAPQSRVGASTSAVLTRHSSGRRCPAKRLPRASASGGLRCAQELVDIFNPSSAVTTAAGRLIGKGLRPLASVRYVKAQIVRHLQTSESDNEFVAFVLRAAVLGMYPAAATRAGLDTYLNLITKGRSALLDAIQPLSSREIFSMVRPQAAPLRPPLLTADRSASSSSTVAESTACSKSCAKSPTPTTLWCCVTVSYAPRSTALRQPESNAEPQRPRKPPPPSRLRRCGQWQSSTARLAAPLFRGGGVRRCAPTGVGEHHCCRRGL